MKKKLILFITIIIVAVMALVGVAYVASKNLSEQPHTEDTTEVEHGQGNYTIEEVPINIEEIAPNPHRSIQFSENIPEAVRVSLNEKAAVSAKILDEDITRADEWFNLGVYYHTANDFEGAKEVWEFLAIVLPENAVVLDNLGKLHHYSLREFTSAEVYFKQSIERDPTSLTPYLELHELYKYSYKTGTTAAVDIINQAINKFPDVIGLYTTLGTYHRDRGEVAQARAAFTTGLNLARDMNDVDLIATFGRELERLPQ